MVALTSEQQNNANLIRQIVAKRGLPPIAATIAIMTAMTESGLQTDPGGAALDHDSRGLFQQRPSQGWGTVQQVLDPTYATNKFLDRLVTVPNWDSMIPWQAAQAVQNSAYSDGSNYQKAYQQAVAITGQPAGKYDATMTAANPTGAGATPVKEDPAKLKADLIAGAGPLAGLLTSTPELSKLLNTAVSSGQTFPDFWNAVTNSAWYRAHSDSLRTSLALKASDPATYAKNLQQATTHVSAMANQLGVLPGSLLLGIATRYMSEGWNDDQLKEFFSKAHVGWNTGAGAAGQAQAQLKQLASDYGQGMGQASFDNWSKLVATGQRTLDQFKSSMVMQAKALFPSLSGQIDSGLTVRDIAQPYIQAKANILEMNPASIDWTKDNTVRAALTGTVGADGKPSGVAPMWQFEQQLRADPRWQNTKNAMDVTSQTLRSLGQQWGFSA
jgi:hypothetical protein